MLYSVNDEIFDSNTNLPARGAGISFNQAEVGAALTLAGSNLSKIQQIQVVKRLSGRSLLHAKILVEHARANVVLF